METHLLRRSVRNPLLTAADFPQPVNSVFNAAVATYAGQTILLNRVEDLGGSSSLWIARSDDGLTFVPDPQPALLSSPDGPFYEVEHFSLEDPRITQIDTDYYITYAGYSQHDCATILAKTRDFLEFERLAIITVPDNKNVVLFPEKIGGRYARLERPMTRTSQQGSVWLSFSPDLIYWGDPQFVMEPRPRMWDDAKIGPGAPPIRTEQGWLEIYHGVRRTASGSLYRLGAVLLDLEEPWRITGRAREAILSPIAEEEFLGNVGNVVFTCGALLVGEELHVYYGAADHVMCLATAPVEDVVALCLRSG